MMQPMGLIAMIATATSNSAKLTMVQAPFRSRADTRERGVNCDLNAGSKVGVGRKLVVNGSPPGGTIAAFDLQNVGTIRWQLLH
jgi:hypothetical protein